MGWESVARVRERYEVERLLGTGSYGEVYAALDPDRASRVALKRLRQTDARALYRFKKEFRALSRLSHPNLVALYELFVLEGEWYLAMELVDGVPIVDFLAGTGVHGPGRVVTVSHAHSLEATLDVVPGGATVEVLAAGASTDAAEVVEPLSVPLELDWDRVRSVFVQVARALAVLHAEGMLHRDLKPHNILVTGTGRPVVLDFGLVTEREPGPNAEDGAIVGTPLYMAPEQATGRPTGSASDMYSLGVMLYEVLTGVPPYAHDNLMTLLWSKVNGGAPSPAERNPCAPRDLCELCMELLEVEPERRPAANEVIARLGRHEERPQAPPSVDGASRPLIGRDRELAVLRGALERSRTAGEPMVALVEGESGMGKTALIEHLLAEVAAEGAAYVLRARCYEQDFVPYKTVDAVVDELSRYLASQPNHRVASLLPPHAHELARLFPVFRQAIDAARGQGLEPLVADPIVAKRRGFGALRELLFRIAREQPVVIFIDDVQWGDRESAEVLIDLMRPPPAPTIFWAVAFRADERATSPILRALLERLEAEPHLARCHLVLGGLAPHDAARLVERLMPDHAAGAEVTQRIAHEGAGHPLFLEELARHAQETSGILPTDDMAATPDSTDRQILLARVLRSRLAELPEGARALLEVLSVAGVPVDPKIAFRAVSSDSVDELAIRRLRAGKLLRTRQAGDHEQLSPYHDRIRATLVAELEDARRRELHLGLALAYEEAGAAARTLVTHFAEAGERVKAAQYARVAGDEASQSLAFHEAVALYRRALEWEPDADEALSRATRSKLAGALVNVGRCKEGASLYAELAAGATDEDEAVHLELRAAQGYFTCAAMDEGLPLLERVTKRVGLGCPRSAAALNAAVFARLGRAFLSRLSLDERPREEIPADIARRIEVSTALAHSLTLPDLMRALYYFLDAYQLAVKVGDARSAVDGLAMMGMFFSDLGWKRAEGTLRRASELAEKAGTPEALGVTAYARGIAAFLDDDWTTGLAEQESAVRLLSRGRNVTAPRQAAQIMLATNLRYLDRFDELLRRTEQTMGEARDVGNPFAEAAAYVDAGFAHLGLGDPEKARAHRERAQALSSDTDMYVEFAGLTLSTRTDLYLGDAAGARARMEENWPRLKRAGLLFLPGAREFYGWLRAAAAAAFAASAPPKEAALARRTARKVVQKTIGRSPRTAFARGNRLSVLAACAWQEGDADEAVAMLEEAIPCFEERGLPVRAAATRRRLAELRGDAGAMAVADDLLGALDVADPERWTRSVMPGFERRP